MITVQTLAIGKLMKLASCVIEINCKKNVMKVTNFG